MRPNRLTGRQVAGRRSAVAFRHSPFAFRLSPVGSRQSAVASCWPARGGRLIIWSHASERQGSIFEYYLSSARLPSRYLARSSGRIVSSGGRRGRVKQAFGAQWRRPTNYRLPSRAPAKSGRQGEGERCANIGRTGAHGRSPGRPIVVHNSRSLQRSLLCPMQKLN